MKEIKTYIIEKLKVSKQVYTLFPKTTDELKQMIKDEIYKNGNECSLNHIDVSKITDMTALFYDSDFNGDISNWDVSNVENMNKMFAHSKFNGDISEWDVSSVKTMSWMFYKSKFNGDISNWNVSDETTQYMPFVGCPLEKIRQNGIKNRYENFKTAYI